MKTLKQSILTITIGLAMAAGISYAWTAPTMAPPDGNVAAPINVSAISQVKDGGLDIKGFFHAFSAALFDGSVTIGSVASTSGSKLDVGGKIHASGDVCTDLAGGKCLSTAGGSGSPASGGLFGWCAAQGNFCSVSAGGTKSPATCIYNSNNGPYQDYGNCGCLSGYSLVITGMTGASQGPEQNAVFYSCYKN